jgi:hypothetical protein
MADKMNNHNNTPQPNLPEPNKHRHRLADGAPDHGHHHYDANFPSTIAAIQKTLNAIQENSNQMDTRLSSMEDSVQDLKTTVAALDTKRPAR